MLRAYLYKLIHSVPFFAAIFGTTAVCMIVLFEGGVNVVTDIEILTYMDTTRELITIFGALPFAANFADEWTHGVTKDCVTRCGVTKYAAVNVVFTFVSSFVSTTGGMLLFVYIASFIKPLNEGSNGGVAPFNVIIANGMPLLYILVFITVFAVSSAMWSVMGLMLSSLMPNKYIALCAPLVASYAIENITDLLPDPLNLYIVSVVSLKWKNGGVQYFYSIWLFVAITLILGVLFSINVRRRVQNELA